MKRNFNKLADEARKILKDHPKTDLQHEELCELIDMIQEGEQFEAISNAWLAGIVAGYKIGKADASESK